MTMLSHADARWYDALYLTERTRRCEGASLSPSPAAEKRLARLRDAFPLGASGFADRLRQEGLDEDGLLSVLSAPRELLRDRSPGAPAWIARLIEAYERAPREAGALAGPLRDHKMAGLLEAVAPVLARARERFDHTLSSLLADAPEPPFSPDLLREELFAPLPGTMLRYVSRALVLEMHVARLEGRLAGETPEDRYRSFVERLSEPGLALDFLARYPVLARCVTEAADRWHEVMTELTARLLADWKGLVRTFFDGRDPGKLASVQADAGDTHRGGRSVMILSFEGGAAIVYKPRSLAVDARFQELLAWLAEDGQGPSLRPLRVWDRGDYGWVEKIERRECEDRAEAERFFERQGAYLALFHALGGTDMHHENLIAAGEHPMPIDLETLFQPAVTLDVTGAELEAARVLGSSVLRVGLLPNRRYTESEEDEVDVSGLMVVEGQLGPQRLPFYTGAGTDELRMERRRLPMAPGHNLPRLNGALLQVVDFEEELVRGFESMYRRIVARRDALLAPGGPLEAFAAAPIRILLRPTRVYATLLREGFHPDVLRDAIHRDRLFDRLWETTDALPVLRRAVLSELADLRRGDIPLFTSFPCSRDLTGGGGEVLEGALDAPGLDRAQERIRAFDDEDLRRQTWFVRASLATVAMGLDDRSAWRPYRFRMADEEASREVLVAEARRVGDRLARLAVAGPNDVTWIGVAMNHKKWLLAPLKNELYSGLPGVVLFLAYLGAVTGECAYTDLAERGHRTVARQIAAEQHNIYSPGLFGGWAGLLHLATHLHALWGRAALLDEAEALAERIPPLLAGDQGADVTYGAAGAIAGLLSLHRARPSRRLLEIAVAAGDALIAGAQPVAGGLGWLVPAAGNEALAGFSHGAAGIAWALGHLAVETGEERFRRTAAAALAFERGVYSPERGNWPDRRPPEAPVPGAPAVEHDMCAWCHGAAGVGMGRLGLAGFEGDPRVEEEIEIALATTRRLGFGGNHCLCHGDLGNLELLLLAAERRSDAAGMREVRRRARGVLDGIAEHGWLCGVPLAVETPGLMNGLAGIGYSLLRIGAPEAVPSILLPEPPRARLGRAG